MIVSQEKYYRLLKDIPALYKGAILKQESTGNYRPVSDIWDTEAGSKSNASLAGATIEAASDWYERVYEVGGVLGKAVFTTKATAKEAFDKLFREK